MRGKPIFSLLAGTTLLAAAGQAAAINVGGVDIKLGINFAASQFYTNVGEVGQELVGYGKIDSINSVPVADLCGDCELTYTLRDYVATSMGSDGLKFMGGTVTVWMGTGPTKNFSTENGGGSAGDLMEASDGQEWLNLKGHPIDAQGNTFVAVQTNVGSTEPTGFATGLLSVDTSGSGVANPFFDSNQIPAQYGGGNADFQFGSSFTALNPVYPGECPGGMACVRGSVDLTTAAIPEPETYALMLSALGLIGYVVHRRRRV